LQLLIMPALLGRQVYKDIIQRFPPKPSVQDQPGEQRLHIPNVQKLRQFLGSHSSWASLDDGDHGFRQRSPPAEANILIGPQPMIIEIRSGGQSEIAGIVVVASTIAHLTKQTPRCHGRKTTALQQFGFADDFLAYEGLQYVCESELGGSHGHPHNDNVITIINKCSYYYIIYDFLRAIFTQRQCTEIPGKTSYFQSSAKSLAQKGCMFLVEYKLAEKENSFKLKGL